GHLEVVACWRSRVPDVPFAGASSVTVGAVPSADAAEAVASPATRTSRNRRASDTGLASLGGGGGCRHDLCRSQVVCASPSTQGFVGCAHGAHPHLLPHHGHRSFRRVLRGPRLRGAWALSDPRGGAQRLHGVAGGRQQARADVQLRCRVVRARNGVRPHRGDRRRPRRDARAAEVGARDRAGAAAVHGARGRIAPVLRARSGSVPDRADRALAARQPIVTMTPSADLVTANGRRSSRPITQVRTDSKSPLLTTSRSVCAFSGAGIRFGPLYLRTSSGPERSAVAAGSNRTTRGVVPSTDTGAPEPSSHSAVPAGTYETRYPGNGPGSNANFTRSTHSSDSTLTAVSSAASLGCEAAATAPASLGGLQSVAEEGFVPPPQPVRRPAAAQIDAVASRIVIARPAYSPDVTVESRFVRKSARCRHTRVTHSPLRCLRWRQSEQQERRRRGALRRSSKS